MNGFVFALAGCLAATAAQSEQRVEINNIYPMDQETIQLADSLYYIQDNVGYFEVVEGPFEDGPARCVGAGFSTRDGRNTIEGVCIFGDGADTFTIRWKAGEQGAANSWTVDSGTGRYRGMTGDGIASTSVEIMYRPMPLRQSHIVGTVTLAPN